MPKLKKYLSALLVPAFICMISTSAPKARAEVIHETSSVENITSGATLERITRFTTEGWLSINVIRVDLSNPYIKVDTLANSDSLQKLATTQALAQQKGAVAAINGGFFNWTASGGYPDGPVAENGKLITASSEYNLYSDSMATFSIDALNQVMYDYWKTGMALVAPNGTSIPVTQFNKPSSSYNDFTVLDRRWGQYSIGSSAGCPDIVEMVVTGDKVSEIRSSQPAVEIPQNGYVVVTRQSGGQLLAGNFKKGDAVSLNISTAPDWSKLKMAVTGSSILLKDGQIPQPFSFDIPGRHPRTIIGSSKDGHQLLMVTVDGRQQGSIGMTLYEAAQLMQELGAYNAMNLDGGGSTSMVSRTPGTSELDVVNSPSEGALRSISTAIGVFSIAPVSALDSLIIGTSDKYMFKGTSRDFSVKGCDRYLNPVPLDSSQVKWKVSGIQGYFTGSTFHALSAGKGKITASLGNITSELEITVLDGPVQLILSGRSVSLPANRTKSLSVVGKDSSGYSASINPSDIMWTSHANGVSVINGVVSTTGEGPGYIEASLGSVKAFCAVTAAGQSARNVDLFEAANGSFTSYPSFVKGSYAISGEQKHSGGSSGKLSYDFSNTEGSRAAYMLFAGDGLPIDSGASGLGLWVYSTHAGSNWLRAELYDSSGNKQVVDFARTVDWTGWKYVEASLQGISSPAVLKRIYLVQISPVADSGCIYLDDLSIITPASAQNDSVQVPGDTPFTDPANVSTDFAGTHDSFRFSVFGDSREPGNLLEKILLTRFADVSNAVCGAAALVGEGSHSTAQSLGIPSVVTGSGFKSFDAAQNRFIQLDMSNQGLRLTDPKQWSWLLQQLDSFNGSNVFVFLSGALSGFSDQLEAALLKDTLSEYHERTGKNIWVFYKGDANSSEMDRGVRYISAAGLDAKGISTSSVDAAKYILVTVKGSSVTYEIKPVVP